MTRKGRKARKGFVVFRLFRDQSTDAQTDALAYELYGLTEEEIGVVGGLDHE